MPDMQRLMAQMMGVDPGGQNLLGDLDDPAGLGSGGPPMNTFNFSGAGAANGGFPHFPGTGMATQKKSGVERYFPLIHAVSVLVLLVFVVGWWEPRLRSARWAGRALEQGWAGRWAGWGGRKGLWRGVKDESVGGVEGLVRSPPQDRGIG